MATAYKMKNFSEKESEVLRAFLFTTPHGEYGFMYPQELVSGEELSPLMSAVSRTHVGLQERVLTFLDEAKPEQTRAMLPMMEPLMDIFRKPDGSLDVKPKTAYFNRKWVLAHGHNSVKEGTQLFGYSENHSDITGKHITGHPLAKPQAKSTRYLSYGKVLDLSLGDEDLKSLKCADEALEFVRYMNSRYLEVTEQLADKVNSHPDTARMLKFLRRDDIVDVEIAKEAELQKSIDDEFEPDEKFVNETREKYLKSVTDPVEVRKQLGKFALDYSRQYLTAVTRSSLVFSDDVRTFGDTITSMISSPRIEDQRRGYGLWQEAEKVAPVLAGKHSHIAVDMWKVHNESEFRGYIEDKFGDIAPRRNDNGERHIVKVLTPQDIEMYTDRFNTALIVFQYSDASLEDIIPQLSEKDVVEIMAKAHQYRGKWDVLHPAISHGGIIVEPLMSYGGYRDIFRHRKGSRTTQLLTTRHGFEVPEIFVTFGMDDGLRKDMEYAARAYELARREDRHKAEKTVPFAALVQSLHSWQMDEIGYIGVLRSPFDKANLSYMYMVRDMVEQVREKMQITGQYFKYDTKDYPAHIWKRGLNWYDTEVRGKP